MLFVVVVEVVVMVVVVVVVVMVVVVVVVMVLVVVVMMMMIYLWNDKESSVARGERGLQGLDDDPHRRIHSLLSYAHRAQH